MPFPVNVLVASTLLLAGAAQAQSLDQVRETFARDVYRASTVDINLGAPQPLLRAVVVLRMKLAEDEHWIAEVVRENSEQPEMTRKALDSVAHLQSPTPTPPELREKLHREGFMEVWLFQSDGHFALKTLALPQRGL